MAYVDTVDLAGTGANQGAAMVGFIQTGVGATARTVNTRLRDTVSVRDFGALGDGANDDTAEIQAALSALSPGQTLDFGHGTYIVGSELDGTALSNVRLAGRATLKAKDATDFVFILDVSGTAGVEIDGLTFDANKAGRTTAAGLLSCLDVNATVSCKLVRCTFKNAAGIGTAPSAASSVAVSASGGCLGLRVDLCSFLDLGTSATSKPSDGIFVRGDYCVISSCHAENVTDHAFVLEGCNFSQIANCTGKNCTSIAGMSNDTASDVQGNVISGVTGTSNYLGSFGGIVGAYTFSTGKLKRCIISDVSLKAADNPSGGGPAIYLFGNLEGLSVSNVAVDAGTETEVTHGIAVDTLVGSVEINNARITQAASNGTGIRLLNGSAGLHIEGCALEGGNYGIYADGTCSFTERNNTFSSNALGLIGLAGTASFWGSTAQNWTPTYSSSAGNAAASFAATPTTTLARVSREGKRVRLELNAGGQVKASTTLSYIELTVPTWAAPPNDALFLTGGSIYDGVGENFVVRPLTSGKLRIYRKDQSSAFAAEAPFLLQFGIEYEVA